MEFQTKIIEYYDRLINTIKELDIDEINRAMNLILKHYEDGTNIYVFGNGGSAATASHMVVDFNKGACEEVEKKFNFYCLNDNIPSITAIANDLSYDDIFYFQLKNKVKKSDLIIAISGSGNSKNIIKAVEYCKNVGCDIIGMTGYNGGKLKPLSTHSLHVNINDMQISEDLHMVFDHMIMKIFYEHLSGRE